MGASIDSASRVLLSWSGGKDSALALWRLQRMPGIEVAGLITTITHDFDRVSMHGVRRSLLERQAESLGLPLYRVEITRGASNSEYEASFGRGLLAQCERGIRTVAFGDVFLEDVRAYRERLLSRHGLQGRYPLWGIDTRALMQEFLSLGFKAIIVCVDPAKLSPEFAGRELDERLLAELPSTVDPCGENGEFHSFVYAGPNFAFPITLARGEVVERDGFYFCDLLPPPAPPLQGGDFYYEAGKMVFTAAYHLRRGYCCGNGCRHCPYPTNAG